MLGYRSFGLALAMMVYMAISAMAGDWGRSTCRNGQCPQAAQSHAAVVVHQVAEIVHPVVQAPVRIAQAVRQSDVVHAPAHPHQQQCCQPQSPCCGQSSTSSGLAQQKAEKQAAIGRVQHVGGGLGGGHYEGVGFSTSGPNEAITASCYWGRKDPIDIGVSCNSNGCYATVIYK